MNRLQLEISAKKALIFSFILGFIVRLIPEVLAFPNPIGFDTIYYAVVMKSGVVWSHWSTFFTSTWLLYAIIVPLYSVLNVDPFLLLKVLAPVLYGLNVAGVYWFARKMLGWDVRMGLLAGGFFAVQLASLRISWDLLRNTLGLGLLLFALPFIKRLDSKRGFACFVLLSLLTVFAHEYAAVTLVVVVLSLVFLRFVKERMSMENKRLFLGFSPALVVFLIGVCLRVFPIRYNIESNIISAGDVVRGNVGGLFFFVNYLGVKTSVDFYGSYFDLVLNVLVLFGLLYLSYLFLVLKGFFRHSVLNVWTGLLLVGSFGCLVVPFCALEYWHRWMFMLVFPFTFYAVNGLSRLLRKHNSGDFQLGINLSNRKVKGVVLSTVLLGGVYLATPVLMNTVNVGVFAVPSVCKYFSFSPTVPYQDVDGVVEAMGWLNDNMKGDSCVVLQHAFLSWGKLYLDESCGIVHFENDVDSAVDVAFEHGFSRVFFVWWNQPIGWYGINVPTYFDRLHDFCRISVYEYVG
jgi:hypothetical protein